MAKYFSYFPKTYYTLENNSRSVDVVTNVMSRFTFNEAFKNNTAVYYNYRIKDGETPEMIANKIYGSSEKHWIILNYNDIVHPQFDWPLSTRAFNKFVDKKYSAEANTQLNETGLSWSNENIYAQYITITQYNDRTQEKLTENIIQIDSSVYANTDISVVETYNLQDGNRIRNETVKSEKTYYQHEEDENEKKRLIKLLKPEFVDAVEQEFRDTIL